MHMKAVQAGYKPRELRIESQPVRRFDDSHTADRSADAGLVDLVQRDARFGCQAQRAGHQQCAT
jgi:hypothetical protein